MLVARRLHQQRARDDDDSGSGGTDTSAGQLQRRHRAKPSTIGFSGPAADHGWLAAINSGAATEAEKYDDIELQTAEGTNDASLQISQVETFINDKVDAIVLLPTDGAALTDVAHPGDGGRDPGHQRRPRVLRPVRRPHHDPRRQLRHGCLGRHLRLRADRGRTTSPTR